MKLRRRPLRLAFTIEDEEQTKEIVKLYLDTFMRKDTDTVYQGDFTRGHFRRRGIK